MLEKRGLGIGREELRLSACLLDVVVDVVSGLRFGQPFQAVVEPNTVQGAQGGRVCPVSDGGQHGQPG